MEEGEMVSCDICDKQFSRYRYMVAHQKRVHHKVGTAQEGQEAHPYDAGEGPSTSRQMMPATAKRGRKKKAAHLPPPQSHELPQGFNDYGEYDETEEGNYALQPQQPRPRMAGTRGGQGIHRPPRGRGSGVGRGRPLPQPQSPQQHHSPPKPRMDIKRSLGIKFGGQISVTSHGAGIPAGGHHRGAVAAAAAAAGPSYSRAPRPPARQLQHPPVQVKEEPLDEEHQLEGEDQYEEDLYDEGGYDDEYAMYENMEEDEEGVYEGYDVDQEYHEEEADIMEGAGEFQEEEEEERELQQPIQQQPHGKAKNK